MMAPIVVPKRANLPLKRNQGGKCLPRYAMRSTGWTVRKKRGLQAEDLTPPAR